MGGNIPFGTRLGRERDLAGLRVTSANSVHACQCHLELVQALAIFRTCHLMTVSRGDESCTALKARGRPHCHGLSSHLAGKWILLTIMRRWGGGMWGIHTGLVGREGGRNVANPRGAKRPTCGGR